jgi:excisionase family DNA binding protein
MTHIPCKPPQSAAISPQFEPLLDTNEAAALLQIHPKSLQKLARAGTVIGIRIGKLWRFRASALNEWLTRMAG